MTRGNVQERNGGKKYLDYIKGSFSRNNETLQKNLDKRLKSIQTEFGLTNGKLEFSETETTEKDKP